MGSELEPRVQGAYIGAVDASGAPEHFVAKIPAACKGTIQKLYIINASAVAAHATNIATVVVNRFRAASGTQIGTQTTDSDVTGYAAIVANTLWEIALDSDALAEVNAGDVIQFVFTEGGTAASGDLTECSAFVEWVPGTGAGQ